MSTNVDEALSVLEAAGVVPKGRDFTLTEPARAAIERFLWRRTLAIATVALGIGSILGSAVQASFVTTSIEKMAEASSAARIAQLTADEANSKALAAKAESERILREIGAAANSNDKLRAALGEALQDGSLHEILLKNVVRYGEPLEVLSVSQVKNGEQQRLTLDAARPDNMAASTGRQTDMTKMMLKRFQ